MNKELIQKFLNKACWDEQAQHELEDWLNVEKFAELIVRECARRSYLEDSGNSEVEEALEFWRKDMLKHFGVEE